MDNIQKTGTQRVDVQRLHQLLSSLGYMVQKDSDQFTANTKRAVAAFQNDMGLPVSGVADNRTWETLTAFYQSRFPQTNAPSEASTKKEPEKAPEKKPNQPLAPQKNMSKPKTTVLKRGMKGDAVSALQKDLKEIGYYIGKIDGIFGPETEQAVRAFQSAYHLSPDGIVGEKTSAALLQALKTAGNKPVEPVPTTKPAPPLPEKEISAPNPQTDSSLHPLIRQGMTGTAVKKLQNQMETLGIYRGAVNGNFGSITAAAVRTLQEKFDLDPTGTMTPETWLALEEDLAKREEEYDSLRTPLPPKSQLVEEPFLKGPSAPKEETAQGYPVLAVGDSGKHVLELQESLSVLGYYSGLLDGVYSTLTSSAVRQFQKDNGLGADGIAGPLTFQKLEEVLAENSTIWNPPLLSAGNTGSDVSNLQKDLQSLGYEIPTDGIFGKSTVDAVKQFQSDFGLVADGIVGPQTWAALNSALTGAPAEPNDLETQSVLSTATIEATADTETVTTLKKDPFLETIHLDTTGNPMMAVVQQQLKDLGYYEGAADGLYGIQTQSAIRAFQNENALLEDGVAGEKTLTAMGMLPFPEAIPTMATATPALKQGSSGDLVTQLQTALQRMGYYNDAIDGFFGPITTAAVKAFQTDAKLTIDGIVGEETLQALESAISGAKSGARPLLRVGSSGDDVRILQQYLKDLGYFSEEPNGEFGVSTRSAVINFQHDYHLTPDGIVGPNVWGELQRLTLGIEPGEPNHSYPSIRQGDSGNSVRELQSYLAQLGYYSGYADGIFGKETDTAVKNYQATKEIEADGIVGPDTWIALLNDIEKLDVVLPNMPTLREGDSGDSVVILQEKLKELSYFPGSVTGSFGAETKDAVMVFQRDSGLGVDGIVGTSTWVALFEKTESGIIVPPGSILKPTLRLGDSGEYVAELQQALSSLSYYTGQINGIFDETTLYAVQSFQDINGLTPTGVVNRNTWYSIDSITPPPVQCR